MSRAQLIFLLLVKAAWVRKDRSLTALLSITVVATMATVALSVYANVGTQLNREFRSFGANVIVTSPQGSLESGQLATIKNTLGSRDELVPIAYAIAQGPSGAPVVVGGTDLELFHAMNSWWSITPANYPQSQALLGARAAEILSPKGRDFQIAFGNKSLQIHPGAVFHSGSEDDSRI